MSNDEMTKEQPDIIWKGSTALLTIILALALISWVGERRALLSGSKAHNHAEEAALAHEKAEREKLSLAVTTISNDLAATRADRQQLSQQLNELKARIGRVGQEKGLLKERIASASEDMGGLRSELQELRGQLDASERLARSSKADLIRIEEHRNSLLADKTNLLSQLTRQEAENQRLKAQLKNQENDAKRMLDDIELRQRLALEATEKAKAQEEQIHELAQKNQFYQARVEELEVQLKNEIETSERLRGVVDAKRSQLEQQMRQLAMAGSDSDTLQEVEEQNKSLKARIKESSELNKRLRTTIKSLEGQQRVSRRQLHDEKAQSRELLSALKEVEKDLAISRRALKKTKATYAQKEKAKVDPLSSPDRTRHIKILTAKLKKANSEIRRLDIDRNALIEEFKRSSDRIRRLMKEVEALKAAKAK